MSIILRGAWAGLQPAASTGKVRNLGIAFHGDNHILSPSKQIEGVSDALRQISRRADCKGGAWLILFIHKMIFFVGDKPIGFGAHGLRQHPCVRRAWNMPPVVSRLVSHRQLNGGRWVHRTRSYSPGWGPGARKIGAGSSRWLRP